MTQSCVEPVVSISATTEAPTTNLAPTTTVAVTTTSLAGGLAMVFAARRRHT